MKNKVTIIGAGMVGSTAAYSLIASNITEEIALIDIKEELVRSQVMDLQHSVPFWGYTRVKVGSYKDIKDSRLAVVCCGASQKPGETRLDLVKKNSAIIKEVVPKIFEQNPETVILMVANPVDILTCLAVKMFPQKKKSILGTGTILDSARFRLLLGEQLKVNPQSIHAYIVGEHGDSELPLWSTATIGNAPIKGLSAKEKKRIFESAKNAAYAIIEGKQATYYAIAAGINHIAESILFNKRTVLPLSHFLEGEYGIRNVALSLPVIVGREGIIDKIQLSVSPKEKDLLKKSASRLKKAGKSIC
jgi:L-lactate dehydrogenase